MAFFQQSGIAWGIAFGAWVVGICKEMRWSVTCASMRHNVMSCAPETITSVSDDWRYQKSIKELKELRSCQVLSGAVRTS